MTSAEEIELDIGDISFEENVNNDVMISGDSILETDAETRQKSDDNAPTEENSVSYPLNQKISAEPEVNFGIITEHEAGGETKKTFVDTSCDKAGEASTISLLVECKEDSVEVKPNGDGAEEHNYKLSSSRAIADDDDDEFSFTLKQKSPEEENEKEENTNVEIAVETTPPALELEESKVEVEKSVNQPTEEINAEFSTIDAPVEAANEWDQVKTVDLDSDKDSVESENFSCEIIGSAESYQYLTDVDRVTSLYSNEIQTSVKRGKFKAVLHWITTPKLKNIYHADRNAIFCLAKHPYNSSDPKHFQMAASVYMSLTGTRLSCQKFGSHWELAGFQGNDPGTDFRGTGMLGLLSLVHVSCDCNLTAGSEAEKVVKQRTKLRDELYRLSRDPEQNFPFALMSINWTRICLQVLREGGLNKLLNNVCSHNNTSLWQNFFELHSAVANRFLTIWKQGHKSIADSGNVLNSLETDLRQRSEILFSQWQRYLNGEVESDKTSEASKKTPKGGQGVKYAVGETSGQNSGHIEFSKLD